MLTQTIDLTPDYDAMFTRYVADIPHSTRHLLETIGEIDYTRDTLNRVEREAATTETREELLNRLNLLVFSVNMAAQCMTSVEQITTFRAAVSTVLTRVNETLQAVRDEVQ